MKNEFLDKYIKDIKQRYNEYITNGWLDELALMFTLQDIGDTLNKIVGDTCKVYEEEFDN